MSQRLAVETGINPITVGNSQVNKLQDAEATLEQGTSRVAQGVARMQLSQVAALLIECWDELDEEEKIAVQVIIDRY